MEVLGIGTINLAVEDAQAVGDRFRRLGLPPITDSLVRLEERPAQIRYHTVPVGGSSLSLVEPSDETSPIARYLGKHGEGIFSISLIVSDLAGLMEVWKREGVDWVLENPLPFASAEGRAHSGKCNWTKPKSTHGILFEVIERNE
ncbi:MAG: VOC family protein [Hyphomicrobiales bacterium]|nr:VOC family protein [Hyphomicrobiales bacterium]